jgi:hypothetical protein
MIFRFSIENYIYQRGFIKNKFPLENSAEWDYRTNYRRKELRRSRGRISVKKYLSIKPRW